MLDIFGGILGAGANVAGSLIGAGEASAAREDNWKVNLLNYYQRQQERQDRINAAQEAQKERKLGATDAAGNRTYFDPSRGWVVDLGTVSKELQALENKEKAQVLTRDLPLKRQIMDKNYARQLQDARDADATRASMFRPGELPQEAASRLKATAGSSLNRNYDNIVDSVMRKMSRTGNSNVGSMLSQLGAGRASEAADLSAKLQLQGEQVADANKYQRMGQYGNLFNMFATRAGAMPNVSFKPDNPSSSTNPLLDKFASRQDSADKMVVDAMGAKGGVLDYTSPEKYGSAIAASGSVLGNMFQNIGASYDRRKALNSLDSSRSYGDF